VGVKTSELDQVSDLFSPKEFGQLLAQAWLNRWDANDAKKLAEDLTKSTRASEHTLRGIQLWWLLPRRGCHY